MKHLLTAEEDAEKRSERMLLCALCDSAVEP